MTIHQLWQKVHRELLSKCKEITRRLTIGMYDCLVIYEERPPSCMKICERYPNVPINLGLTGILHLNYNSVIRYKSIWRIGWKPPNMN
jgi:hypothetical protein